MSKLLYDFLEAKGIKSRDKLSPDEKATFEKWEKILKKDVRVEDIISLIDESLAELQKQWLELDEKNPISFIFYWRDQLYIKARIKNLMLIKDLVDSSNNNKKSLERYLRDLLKK